MTKRKLEYLIDSVLFVTKGILEREDVVAKNIDDGMHIKYDYDKKRDVYVKPEGSKCWDLITRRMKHLQKRDKDYKMVVDIIKRLDKFYDEVGLDGFE